MLTMEEICLLFPRNARNYISMVVNAPFQGISVADFTGKAAEYAGSSFEDDVS